MYREENFVVKRKHRFLVPWQNRFCAVWESPLFYHRKPYYLNIKFHSNFYIAETLTNHPELQRLIDGNTFPKTIYRIIDYKQHSSLLRLHYKLKFQVSEISHNIYLQLNGSKVFTNGKFKTLLPNKKYSLKLKILSIDSIQYILNEYQYIPNHTKEVGYELYDEINKMSFTQPIEISNVLEKFNYSQATLYRFFKDVIGIYPSTVWMDRKLIGFKQHLLEGQENISEIYWQYGFTNQRSLNRNFKKTFGIAPLEFRRKYQRT